MNTRHEYLKTILSHSENKARALFSFIISLVLTGAMFFVLRGTAEDFLKRRKNLLALFFASLMLFALTGVASAAGVIPEMDLITTYSSTGGNSTYKDNAQDVVYKIQQGDVITFSITTAQSGLNYLWQVKKGSEVIASSTEGTTFNWTVPSATSTWEIEIEATLKDGIGNTIGRESVSWSITTSDLKTVNPGESIQAAIDSLPPEGGVVELTAGTWDISSTLKIDKSNVVLRGAGMYESVIKASADIKLLLIRGLNATDPDPWAGPFPVPPDPAFIVDVTIENLTLEGTGVGLSTDYGIYVHEGWKVSINNVYVNRTRGAGIYLLYSYNSTVSSNKVSNVGREGIKFFRSPYTTIANNIVQGGTGVGSPNDGICHNTDGENSIVENNTVSGFGSSGFYVYGDDSTWRNNILYSNRWGMDISTGAQNNIIEYNIIRNNNQYGIMVREGSLTKNQTIRGNLIYSNILGGINSVFVFSPKVPPTITIESNTIASNGGDGISHNLPTVTFSTKNNIIVGNSGYGLSNTVGTMTSSYNDVWNNTLSNYNGTSAGTGDISTDPFFANSSLGDFHLKSQAGRWTPTGWVTDSVTSPAIDAGDPTSDYSNEPAPNGGRINIGAYGNTPEASKSPGGSSIDINQDGVIDISDLRIVALHFGETTTSPYPRYDVDANGTVDILDLRQVAGGM